MLKLPNRSVIRITGEDARTYLQGLITNDVNKLDEKHALYAAMQTPQGKYLFDFILYQAGGDILLDVESSRAADLIKRLTMYKLRSKVQIAAAPELAVYADSEKGVNDPRLKNLGKRLVTAEPQAENENFAAYEQKRIRLGVVDTADLLPEKSFILQNHFELFNGVDFNKGCYVGQEIVARTKYKGTITRQLFRVEADAELPESGGEIKSAGKVIGELRSTSGKYAIAQCEVAEVFPDREYEVGGVAVSLNPVHHSS